MYARRQTSRGDGWEARYSGLASKSATVLDMMAWRFTFIASIASGSRPTDTLSNTPTVSFFRHFRELAVPQFAETYITWPASPFLAYSSWVKVESISTNCSRQSRWWYCWIPRWWMHVIALFVNSPKLCGL